MTIKCTFCGKENMHDAPYCSYCGKAFPSVESITTLYALNNNELSVLSQRSQPVSASASLSDHGKESDPIPEVLDNFKESMPQNVSQTIQQISVPDFYDKLDQAISLIKKDEDDKAKKILSSLSTYTSDDLYKSRLNEHNDFTDSDLIQVKKDLNYTVNMVIILLAIIERDRHTSQGYSEFVSLCEKAANNGSCVAASELYDFYHLGHYLFRGFDEWISENRRKIERIKWAGFAIDMLEANEHDVKIECSLYEYKELKDGSISDNHRGINSFEQIRAIINAKSFDFFETDDYGSLIKYYGRVPDIIIPDHVKTIESRAFENNSFINSITIPNSVTHIKSFAFQFCTSLKSITLPDSIEKIDSDAFLGCTSLSEISLYKKTDYDDSAFPAHTKIKRRLFRNIF